jgi:polyisoprenyl-phosphate glycosyltransferase
MPEGAEQRRPDGAEQRPAGEAPLRQVRSTGRRQLVSVVVPCFDEAATIDESHRQLAALADRLATNHGLDTEVVYVDDGSQDDTRARLLTLQTRDPRVRVIGLSRNFGHQIAVSAGLEHAAGDAVVLIDADLQDPPAVVDQMVARWRAGVDVAYGQRTRRDGETRFKRWTATLFYRGIDRMSPVSIPLDTGDFRLMDRCVVDALLAMPERDRFIRGMVAWVGFRQEAVPYVRAPRTAGTTKYPLRRMLSFAADGILSFSLVPLRLAVLAGVAASTLAAAGIVYALVLRLFTDRWVTGWTALFIAMLFIGGVQLLFLGILGEYLGRIYSEVKRRPLYLVEKRAGFVHDPIPPAAVRPAEVMPASRDA